jgi:hypothetical protein
MLAPDLSRRQGTEQRVRMTQDRRKSYNTPHSRECVTKLLRSR